MQIHPIATHASLPDMPSLVNQHIDWTAATANFLTTGRVTADDLLLTLGGDQDYLFCSRTSIALALQGQTPGDSTVFEIYNKDGDNTDNVALRLLSLGTPGNQTNLEGLDIRFTAATEALISTNIVAGSGVRRQIRFDASGSLDFQLVLNTDNTTDIADLSFLNVSGDSFQAGPVTLVNALNATQDDTEFAININGTSGTDTVLGVYRHSENIFNPTLRFIKARGTISSPGLPLSGDFVGGIDARVWDGSDYLTSAGAFGWQLVENVAGNSAPSKFFISTNPGAAGGTVRLTIDKDGRFGLNVDPALAVLHLSAGTATAGTAPLKFSSGTNLTVAEAGVLEYDGTCLYFTEVIDRRCISLAADSIVSTTSVSNTTTEDLLYTATVSAAELHTAKVIMVQGFGEFTTNDGANRVTLRVYIGTVEIAEILSPVGIVSGESWHINCVMTIRTTGAGGTVSSHADVNIKDTILETNISSQDIDTTAANDITITAQWNTADAGDIITINQGFIEVLN